MNPPIKLVETQTILEIIGTNVYQQSNQCEKRNKAKVPPIPNIVLVFSTSVNCVTFLLDIGIEFNFTF